MARISLRAYNAEIETLIENEKTDEAVAHCRHILTIFPKHVHTYRLLGKAYLENRQHTEALDIFERLLTAVPDDFIAHLGMSIIREEEGNLDAAIWHMERAFELQPYNSAIQDEMRRLYGRRDGAEPVKIRLTRGALARMYARGNLYEQAVAEIRQVLANEPQRPDMQVLLAQMYEKMEKPVQAAEACSRLLKKYPYCLEANRILAHVLENSKRPEEAKTYRERLQALNPYYAYINPQAPTLEDIPDEAVQLEKMKYTSTDILPVQQESGWLTTIGVEETALETIQEEEELPAWLTGEEEPQEAATASDSLAEAPASEEELIPDWMKEAGWGPDSGEFDESAVSLDGADETFAEETEEGAAPAELPDWLQEIAPPEVATGMLTTPGEEQDEEEDQALAALIDTGSLGPLPESKAAPAEELPDWLSEVGEQEAGIGEQAEPSSTVHGLPSETEEIPDWLSEVSEQGAGIGEQAEATPAEEIPDWLSEVGEQETGMGEQAEAAPAEEIPDWLSEVGEQETAVSEQEEPIPTEEIPDWLSEASEQEAGIGEQAEPSSTVSGPPSEAEPPSEPEAPEDMDAAMAWL
ncbi:MAG TPA: tetratricopeptide repeat protein, partial [Chloroflexi bacterium]|nr:tetratricopeptide repeat protein [Chloroflexota bacterium]